MLRIVQFVEKCKKKISKFSFVKNLPTLRKISKNDPNFQKNRKQPMFRPIRPLNDNRYTKSAFLKKIVLEVQFPNMSLNFLYDLGLLRYEFFKKVRFQILHTLNHKMPSIWTVGAIVFLSMKESCKTKSAFIKLKALEVQFPKMSLNFLYDFRLLRYEFFKKVRFSKNFQKK